MIKYWLKKADLRERADIIIQRQTPELSRSFIKKLSEEGKLFFKGKTVVASFRPKTYGILRLDYDLKLLEQIPKLKLKVIHEDNDLMIINKPSGVIVHTRGRYWQEASVASSLRQYFQPKPPKLPLSEQDLRTGIVHRLDRGTSGLLLCAKNQATQKALQAQFQAQAIEKTYLAVIAANPKLPEKGLIDKPVGRNFTQPTKFKVTPQGKASQTFFAIKEKHSKYYLLAIQPLTGRTHQIRVHLASLNSAVVGDPIYGGLKAARLMLHAQKLSFRHPKTAQQLSFRAQMPKIFRETLQQP